MGYLQIAVDQVSVMHVLDGHNRLIEELKSLNLVKALVLMDIIKQIPVFGIIEDQIDLSSMFEAFMKPDDVAVLQLAVD